jgi:hypothetical protein
MRADGARDRTSAQRKEAKRGEDKRGAGLAGVLPGRCSWDSRSSRMQEEPDPRGRAYDSGNKESLVRVPFHVRVLGGVICTMQHSTVHQKGSRLAEAQLGMQQAGMPAERAGRRVQAEGRAGEPTVGQRLLQLGSAHRQLGRADALLLLRLNRRRAASQAGRRSRRYWSSRPAAGTGAGQGWPPQWQHLCSMLLQQAGWMALGGRDRSKQGLPQRHLAQSGLQFARLPWSRLL